MVGLLVAAFILFATWDEPTGSAEFMWLAHDLLTRDPFASTILAIMFAAAGILDSFRPRATHKESK